MSIYAGSNSGRQSVGDPGHCERCVLVGHALAHPELGCADVGCNARHGDEEQDQEMVDLYRKAEHDFAVEGGKRSIVEILRVAYGLSMGQAIDCVQAGVAQVAIAHLRKGVEGREVVSNEHPIRQYLGDERIDNTTDIVVLLRSPGAASRIKKALIEYARRDTRGLDPGASVIRARLANAGLDVKEIDWVMEP